MEPNTICGRHPELFRRDKKRLQYSEKAKRTILTKEAKIKPMKKIVFLLAVCLPIIAAMSQNTSNQKTDSHSNMTQDSILTKSDTCKLIPKHKSITVQDSILVRLDTLLQLNNIILEDLYRNASQAKGRYKLYPTENIYTLLQLDTWTGEVQQIQWSLKSSEEGSFTINSDDLSWSNSHFELYPTKNMYQFMLLDTMNGRKWHIQWGLKDSERWIRRIY